MWRICFLIQNCWKMRRDNVLSGKCVKNIYFESVSDTSCADKWEAAIIGIRSDERRNKPRIALCQWIWSIDWGNLPKCMGIQLQVHYFVPVLNWLSSVHHKHSPKLKLLMHSLISQMEKLIRHFSGGQDQWLRNNGCADVTPRTWGVNAYVTCSKTGSFPISFKFTVLNIQISKYPRKHIKMKTL